MKNKINIRYFVGHYQPIYTGAGKSLEKLIHALDKDAFNIEIITAYKKGLKRKEQKDGYTITRLGRGFFNDYGHLNSFGKINFSMAAAFYNLTHRKYDILKFIGVGQVAFFSILVAKLLKKPIVNKTTAVGDDDPKKLTKSFIGRLLIKLLNKNAVHWVISKEIYDNCTNYTNWKKEHLFLITNPVKIAFKDYKILLKQRAKVANQSSKKIFLFVGILDKRKGVDVLLKLWNDLNINATLNLCGPYGLDDAVNQNLKENKNSNITLLGELTREEIQTQYLKADYFIFPSNREGLPNVVLESMSYGLPIITNKIDGVTDFLIGDNNERGILINDNNFKQWSKTIHKIIENKDSLESKAKNAYYWVYENSSYEVVSNKMKKMYQELVNGKI